MRMSMKEKMVEWIQGKLMSVDFHDEIEEEAVHEEEEGVRFSTLKYPRQ
ncbi:hypothetical protein L1765_02010 [Microaerobacter geothermalis]|nr:hypothetical protein [Microaerobacter geothermalis]MCF6092769.1 hypothetical protein [Microaerobacter geothermalis]